MTVCIRLIFKNTVQNTILFGFPAEAFQLTVAYREHFEFLAAFEHTGQPRFTASLFLILQYCIEQNCQSLSRFTADFCSHFNSVEGHSHDLFGCFS